MTYIYIYMSLGFKSLSTKQCGLRIGLKTDNAIYEIRNEILNAKNIVPLVGGIVCDLKLLNCNDNGKLSELKLCGINGKRSCILSTLS